jgi:hypothetical protein
MLYNEVIIYCIYFGNRGNEIHCCSVNHCRSLIMQAKTRTHRISIYVPSKIRFFLDGVSYIALFRDMVSLNCLNLFKITKAIYEKIVYYAFEAYLRVPYFWSRSGASEVCIHTERRMGFQIPLFQIQLR